MPLQEPAGHRESALNYCRDQALSRTPVVPDFSAQWAQQ
jgi:hypothetical protein